MIDDMDPELEKLRMKRAQQLMVLVREKEERRSWPSSPINVTDPEFSNTISKYPLVLVDFWATWCQPCRMMAPILDSVAQDMQGKVVIAKLDVDRNQRTAGEFNVKGIPTLLVFRDGQPVERITGVISRKTLIDLIGRYFQQDR